MKKLIIPVAVILLVVAGVYLILKGPDADQSFQSFIASDVQFAITQYDLDDRITEFRDSPLGMTLDTLDYEKIGRELTMSEAEIGNVLDFKKNLAELFNNTLFKTLFGSQVTCALFPFTYRNDIALEDQLLANLLIVARPKHGARLIDVASWFDFSTDTMSKSRYGSHSITRYDVEDGRRISGVRMNELLILSFNETVLRKSLDVYDGEIPGIYEVDSYRTHIDRFTGASLIAFSDFQKMSALLHDISEGLLKDNSSLTFDDQATAGYRTGLFGAWRHEDRIVDQAIITFSPELLDARTRTRLQAPVQTPHSYQNAGQNTILYHWTNQLDIASLTTVISGTEPATSRTGESPLDSVLSVANLSAEKFADLFTGDLTLAVQGLDDEQLVPLPLFMLSLESSDIELLKSSTDTLIEHYSIPVRRKKIGDKGELISWGGIIGIGSVLPAFAFAGDSLIISSNRDEVRAIINNETRKNLADNEQFARVSEELLKPSNSVTYLELSEFTGMIKEMTNWGSTMIALKDRQLAQKSKVIIDELINPLLDGLSMYKAIASRKYIEENWILFESQTILDHGK